MVPLSVFPKVYDAKAEQCGSVALKPSLNMLVVNAA